MNLTRPLRSHPFVLSTLALALGLFVFASCGDDDNEAIRRGVGAECAVPADCAETAPECLAFKGGYCGIKGCAADVDCPSGSRCVAHTDGMNYCFLTCADKPECNVNRTTDNESNCSSSVTFVEGNTNDAGVNTKACVPPSAS